MIGFGIDYIPVEKRPDMDFADNGKDIFMPMVSLSIPIFNKKYKSNSKQNELKQLEIDAQKQSQFNKLQQVMDEALNERLASRISYNTQIKNLQQQYQRCRRHLPRRKLKRDPNPNLERSLQKFRSTVKKSLTSPKMMPTPVPMTSFNPSNSTRTSSTKCRQVETPFKVGRRVGMSGRLQVSKMILPGWAGRWQSLPLR